MPIDLTDYKTRIKALYQEAFATLSEPSTDVESDVNYVSEAFPYVTLRTGVIDIEGDGEEHDLYTIEIVAEVYAGWVGRDTPSGETEARIDTWIMTLMEYFNQRELLQSAAYPDAPDDLDYARLTNSTGYRQSRTGGASPDSKKLTTLTHVLHANRIVEQLYL